MNIYQENEQNERKICNEGDISIDSGGGDDDGITKQTTVDGG